jgi:uncharacterized protein involved in exopolysaccharide biosynthesis
MEKVFEAKVERLFQARDFVALLKKQWKLFAGLFVGLLLFSILLFVFKIPYVGKGSLLVNDSQNSSLQAFSTSYFGMTKTVVDGKKGNTQIGKQLEVLHTREFYNKFLDKIKARGESPNLSIEEQQAYNLIKTKYLDGFAQDEESRLKFVMKLDSWFQAKLDSDYEIKISFATPSKELSMFLTNTALEMSSDYLREREMNEIQRVEDFITQQRAAVDKNIKEMTQELSDFQSKPQNLISMTSKEKLGEYLSDLMVRMNEARLKIAENNKDIDFLRAESGGGAQPAGSALYGTGGRIASLHLENKMLESRLAQLKGSIDSIGQQLKVLPVSVQMLEDKRKKSELEYAKYKELSETLAKVEAQKLSVTDRFEVLEKARMDNTLPQVDLLTLSFLSFVLALMLGLTVAYMDMLWNPKVAVKEVPRGISVVDDHNKDPRVVLDKSKIKFQLGNQDAIQ